MKSVLSEIKKIRKNEALIIDYGNTNRYRIVVNESDGSKTAYYFSTPIYNSQTRRLVDIKYHQKDGNAYLVGSNANIVFSNNITLENAEGACRVSLNSPVRFISDCELKCGSDRILPTTNGFVYKFNTKYGSKCFFELEVDVPFMDIRCNDRCFALLSGTYRPFVTVSCLGETDESDFIIAPAKLEYQKISDRKYRICVDSYTSVGKWVSFEVNLYEQKLFQDTTVESENPKINNVFGAAAFIGNTKQYGQQWLYSKIDYSKIWELMDKRIIKADLHLPKLNKTNAVIGVFRLEARFCSLGSTWQNKIPGFSTALYSEIGRDYQSINITDIFSDRYGNFIKSHGIILKTNTDDSAFSVIATGDSCFCPQILAINYR